MLFPKKELFFSVLVILITVAPLVADIPVNQTKPDLEIGVDEKLGEYVPLDLQFNDENGQPVLLKDLIKKPTVLSLVYFNCPGICSPLLNGEVDVFDKMEMEPGKDYQAITVSFNPREGVELAVKKKRNLFNAFLQRPFPSGAWQWLTGDSLNIQKLTNAVGFRYKKVGSQYVHAGTLIVLSPKGKITRYLRGIQYQPFDLKMALTEAAQGRVGPTISKVLLYCFSYDPAGRKYVFNVTKVAATLFLAFVVVFIGILTLKGKVRFKKVR